jgi:hypothetical protein
MKKENFCESDKKIYSAMFLKQIIQCKNYDERSGMTTCAMLFCWECRMPIRYTRMRERQDTVNEKEEINKQTNNLQTIGECFKLLLNVFQTSDYRLIDFSKEKFSHSFVG